MSECVYALKEQCCLDARDAAADCEHHWWTSESMLQTFSTSCAERRSIMHCSTCTSSCRAVLLLYHMIRRVWRGTLICCVGYSNPREPRMILGGITLERPVLQHAQTSEFFSKVDPRALVNSIFSCSVLECASPFENNSARIVKLQLRQRLWGRKRMRMEPGTP